MGRRIWSLPGLCLLSTLALSSCGWVGGTAERYMPRYMAKAHFKEAAPLTWCELLESCGYENYDDLRDCKDDFLDGLGCETGRYHAHKGNACYEAILDATCDTVESADPAYSEEPGDIAPICDEVCTGG